MAATAVYAPTLTASSTVNAISGATANAVTQNALSYYFSIAGPANVNVPLIIYSNGGINYQGSFGDVSGELEGLASARLNIGGTGTGVDLGSEQLIVGFCSSTDLGCTPETSLRIHLRDIPTFWYHRALSIKSHWSPTRMLVWTFPETDSQVPGSLRPSTPIS